MQKKPGIYIIMPFLLFFFFRYISSVRSTLIVNLCAALCFGYLLFIIATEHSKSKVFILLKTCNSLIKQFYIGSFQNFTVCVHILCLYKMYICFYFQTGCLIISALLQYFFMAIFSIMVCFGINLAFEVYEVFSTRSKFAVFSLIGWGKK